MEYHNVRIRTRTHAIWDAPGSLHGVLRNPVKNQRPQNLILTGAVEDVPFPKSCTYFRVPKLEGIDHAQAHRGARTTQRVAWSKIKYGEKRAITLEEHHKIVARELNPERRRFYELLWHLGSSQSDLAHLHPEDIDWKDRTITFNRLELVYK